MDKTRMQQYMSQMRAMFNKHALYSDESPQYQIPFEPNPGDTVKIISGPLEDFVGKIETIDAENQKCRVSVSMFGRQTPVDLELYQIEPASED